VYQKCWSRELLPAAHDHCRKCCLEALQAGARTVVIDNTNVQTKYMAVYTQMAADASAKVVVVEVICHSLSELRRRGLHSVPIEVLGKMQARWEPCPGAIRLLSPPADLQTVRCNAGPRSGVGIRRWLEMNRCYHHSTNRARTHLEMAVGTQPAKFVSIPPSLANEFIAQVAAELDGRRAGAAESMFYLAEERSNDLFRFFVDLDVVADEPMDRSILDSIVSVAQSVIGNAYGADATKVLVTGSLHPEELADGRWKSGRHLHFPNLTVSPETAITVIRPRLVEALSLSKIGARSSEWQGNVDWGHAVDEAVYHPNGGNLRMLGARKVKKGVDLGAARLHSLLAVYEAAEYGEVNEDSMAEYRENTEQLLRDLSIRCNSRPESKLES